MAFAADAPAFLVDYGEAVSWTAAAPPNAVTTGLMILDQPDADVGSSHDISREYEATFETAAWPGLKRGEVLVVAAGPLAGSYTLRTDPYRKVDGVFSCAKLSKV